MPEANRGFTLVELIITMALILVFVVIAIPRFLDRRANAWEAVAQRDLRAGVIAQQLLHTHAGRYTGDVLELEEEGLTPSDGVDLWIDPSSTAMRFQIHSQHCSGGGQFRYRSDGSGTIERLERAERAC